MKGSKQNDRNAEMIGLPGAHRTGKTTLAKRFSEVTGVPFIATGASAVFAELGLDPRADYPIEKRLFIQRKILEAAQKVYSGAGQQFITDRTPLDYLAYTLADIQRETLNSDRELELRKYMEDCFRLCNCYFSTLVVVQPGIQPIDEPGKARADFGYTEHIASLIMGLVCHESIDAVHYFIPRSMTDLDRRVRCIQYSISEARKKFDLQIQAAIENGLYIQ